MSGPESAKRLKSFIERIEKVEEEQKDSAAAKRDIYSEAKGAGFDAATIRWAVKERKMGAADRAERDALRDTYAHALGLAVDAVLSGEMSARDAATMYGVGKTSVYKEIGVRALSAQHREMTEEDLGDPLLVIDKPRAQFREKVRAIAASVKLPPGPAISAMTGDVEMPPIPEFLRRTA